MQLTLDRSSASAALALAAAAGLAWASLVSAEPPMGLVGYLGAWALMMTAMMLPSIAPLALLYRGSRVGLGVGYLGVWTVTGLVPYALMEWELAPAAPLALALAGVYELSPAKAACLARCRNAAAFLIEHYRSGPFRLGVEHGLWCIGCCVGLMAVLVFAAAMGVVWAAAIAAVVFAQKVLPLGGLSARIVGAGLLAAAAAFALAEGRSLG